MRTQLQQLSANTYPKLLEQYVATTCSTIPKQLRDNYTETYLGATNNSTQIDTLNKVTSSNRNSEQEEITYPKLLKDKRTTGQKSRRYSNPATTSRSLNSSTQVSKLVSIKKSYGDDLNATNLAPNGGVNQRQSTDLCLDE
ncbi:hypothetical protein F511_26855 [Dorcoceras hygrometricum]|uniref:Uncharacterized protein n=1 Tax=Dorcoceras hygrometricum TaxID=472368 RepID=A0A2Z7APQ3_9LAMI|nr:hypothetical protein F511_26855 [Dorcoceras hygrometricum]